MQIFSMARQHHWAMASKLAGEISSSSMSSYRFAKRMWR